MENNLPAYSLLGSRINAVQYDQILAQMQVWINSHNHGRYVVVANTHVVMESRQNPGLRQAVDQADMVIPDGMPLVVAARWRGFPLRRRADGPGLLVEALAQSGARGWRHYFYGGTPQVLEQLNTQIQMRWPDAVIAGSDAPPFRPLTPEEERAAVERIHSARPDVLWVGLGCPKQERWMLEHSDRLEVPVMLGVGQAFDLVAGVKQRAPGWMCNLGLEWLYRLVREPRRLGKRYLLYNPWFVWLFLREQAAWLRSQR